MCVARTLITSLSLLISSSSFKFLSHSSMYHFLKSSVEAGRLPPKSDSSICFSFKCFQNFRPFEYHYFVRANYLLTLKEIAFLIVFLVPFIHHVHPLPTSYLFSRFHLGKVRFQHTQKNTPLFRVPGVSLEKLLVAHGLDIVNVFHHFRCRVVNKVHDFLDLLLVLKCSSINNKVKNQQKTDTYNWCVAGSSRGVVPNKPPKRLTSDRVKNRAMCVFMIVCLLCV